MKRILSIQSNVVYGYAGNKVAVFPMQLLGVDVLPINSVQLSSNTVYQGYDGAILESGQITKIINSLEKIGILSTIDAVISGYIGHAKQGEEILNAVNKIKQHNPELLYICDPVMGGDIQKGSVVSSDIVDFFMHEAVPQADFITPNLVELQVLSQTKIDDFSAVISSIKKVQKSCPQIVVKNLLHASQNPAEFEMILATKENYWHLARPFYPFKHRPLGVGDLICCVFTAQLVQNHSPLPAFEYAANVANDVLKLTYEKQSRELELIAAQDLIRKPNLIYFASTLNQLFK